MQVRKIEKLNSSILLLIEQSFGDTYAEEFSELFYSASYGQLFGLYDEGRLISVAYIIPEEVSYDFFSLSWVCTFEAFKGKGFATTLLRHILNNVHELTESDDLVIVQLCCEIKLIKFYENLGFKLLTTLQNGMVLMIIEINP